jgi:hypothetical protein
MRRKIQYQVLIPKNIWDKYEKNFFVDFIRDRYMLESGSSYILNIFCEVASTPEIDFFFLHMNKAINRDFGTTDISYFRVIKSEVTEIELMGQLT